MKDFSIFLTLGILFIILQCTFFSFQNYSPDLVLLLIVYKGCKSSSKIKDFPLVFLLGYFMDLFCAIKIGVFSSFLVLSFLLCSWLNLKFSLENLPIQTIICFLFASLKGLFLSLLQGYYGINSKEILIHSFINGGLTPFVFPILKQIEAKSRARSPERALY